MAINAKIFSIFVLCNTFFFGCKPAERFSGSELKELNIDNDPWFDLFRPTNIARISLEQLQRQRLQTKLKIFKIEMLDLLGIGTSANVSLRPQGGGSVQRTETWKLDVTIDPGTIITSFENGPTNS